MTAGDGRGATEGDVTSWSSARVSRLSRRGILVAAGGAGLLLAGGRRIGAWPAWDAGSGAWPGAAIHEPVSANLSSIPVEVGSASEPPSAASSAASQSATAGAEPLAPVLSDVARIEPWEALLFLAGRDPRHPGAGLDTLMGFSPADILETMDTVVMDSVLANRGGSALGTLYGLIAGQVLDALLAVYGDQSVVLALDAGHGGKRGVFYDPGSNGTEAEHTRRTVEAIEARAADPRYVSITIRRIYNDEIGDDFGLPPPEDRKSAAALTMRLIRAAMLAHEADAWNGAHPDAPVAVHLLSVHYNAGSGGILVLHQGASIPPAFQQRSIAYAGAYVQHARPALNRTGLLPYQLGLALGTGLSDDRLLYEPPFRVAARNPYTGADRSSFPRRYAMLESSLLQRDYAHGALIYNGLL